MVANGSGEIPVCLRFIGCPRDRLEADPDRSVAAQRTAACKPSLVHRILQAVGRGGGLPDQRRVLLLHLVGLIDGGVDLPDAIALFGRGRADLAVIAAIAAMLVWNAVPPITSTIRSDGALVSSIAATTWPSFPARWS